MYKEYRITVDKTIFGSTTITGRPRSPGFRYVVTVESDTGTDKLSEVDNRTQYDAIDEGLAKLLMLLAMRDERAIVKVVRYTSPISEGAKQMLADKYATESSFASLTL
ncbi:hypothetical protein MPH47_12175 [Psychrobacillus psychrodurans]|uniref:hypothetical protein n=1 Tax=Psychrobacillus psychrodurans TaxID=126157 RepID=UPI001F4D71E4|nr:hypothetical protein [Psychrobacillus psychrodurans]MCK1997972.1 hypothetical protein [Psychrobacillus psychrodurans]